MLGIIGLIQLWLIRWSHILFSDASPIDLLKPWVGLDFFGICRSATKALIRVLVQQFDTKITSVIRQEAIVKSRFSILNISVELLAIF